MTEELLKQSKIKILILEDVPADAELMEYEIRKAGIDFQTRLVATENTFIKELNDFSPDIVLSDYRLPSYDGFSALKAARDKYQDIPFIIISGTLGEERATEIFKEGATDYVLKNKLFKLGPAVKRVLKEAGERAIQKQSEQALIESEKRYRLLFDLESDAIILVDTDSGYIIDANNAASSLYGYSKKELLQKKNTDLSAEPEETSKAVRDRMTFVPIRYHRKKDGTTFPVEITMAYVIWRGQELHLAAVRDITDRMETEKLLHEEKTKFYNLSESAPFGMLLIDKDDTMMYSNRKFTEILGYDIHDIRNGKEWFSKAYPDPDYREYVRETWIKDLKSTGIGEQRPRIFKVRCKDGNEKIINFIPVLLESGKQIVTIEDITERIKAEERIKESETRYRTLFESANDAIFLLERDMFVDLNKKTLEMFQCTREQIIGKSPYRFSPTLQPDGRNSTEMALEKIRAALAGEPQFFEWQHCKYDGTPFDTEVSLNVIRLEKGAFIHAVVHDISARKKTERKIKKAEEKYRDIVEFALEGIFQATPEGKSLIVNSAYASILKYSSPEEFLTSVNDIRQVYVDPEQRNELINIMNREGRATGFETQFYCKDKSIVWISVNIRAVRDNVGKTLYYEGTIEDITKRKSAEEGLKQNMEKLRRAMGGIINVIVTTIESRDPYTSGHQKRVADLARAIATEIGFPPEQIDGIRMAGMIHDLGKISIPAEILSKPSKLTDAEFSLIKQHPTIGYHILKEIEFSRPIAHIIYQHHERIDGSGYPQGLRGEEIIPEARIIAVADVVESMSSHRPYRPALGVEAALDEIRKNRGVLYDSLVVDACVKLFQEKRFSFR